MSKTCVSTKHEVPSSFYKIPGSDTQVRCETTKKGEVVKVTEQPARFFKTVQQTDSFSKK